MVTPWDPSLYFEFAQKCDGKSFGLECEQCGEPADWELFYSGAGCPSEERYLCVIHFKEEIKDDKFWD